VSGPGRLAVIGLGTIGEALVAGLLRAGTVRREDVAGTVAHEPSLARVRGRLDIRVTRDNRDAVRGRDVVVLAVKPQNMDGVLRDIAPAIAPEQLVISVAASISTAFVQARLPAGIPVVRAMPNTPMVVGAAMTALACGPHAGARHSAIARTLFGALGETVAVDEALMDAVTALSASGPAYLFVVVEALAEAGVKLGLPRPVATHLVAQTMLGSARMVLESREHPALLKDAVTTPAGCTVDGLLELEDGKLRVTLVKAVVRAAARAGELAAAATSPPS
jgi:pyrroline-5-carboxylate reductase